LRPAAQEERLRAGTAFVAAHRPHDTGARRIEGDLRLQTRYERQYSISPCQRCHHQTPLASLLRLCGDAVEAVPERITAAGEAVALRLSLAADRHPPDAHG